MLQEERFNKILEELAENGAVKNVDLSRSCLLYTSRCV